MTLNRSPVILSLLLLATGGFLYAFPAGSLAFVGLVLLHIVSGLALAVWIAIFATSRFLELDSGERAGWLVVTFGTILGVVLIFTGTTRPYIPWMYAHIGLCLAGLLILTARSFGFNAEGRSIPLRIALLVTLTAGLATAAWGIRTSWHDGFRIENPDLPPVTMDAEGGGPDSPFFPSSAQTSTDGYVPVDFFMESEKCQRCHQDIYGQWSSSAHRFSSFNNQWYRKSIEYMQEVVGTTPSKWCGGCHDPAVLYTGLMDLPLEDIIDREESHVGLGCVMCHSISVESTMGQAGFTVDYPPLYQLATSENPIVQAVHDFVVKLNPEAHRRSFMKPPLRDQASEFCSSCHKVHLDVPVNNYRWIRGFNDYDNWQASGVSGQGARSFYYPATPQTCTDCHMPVTPSSDMGNVDGMVHSHRFPGANTALPTANQDQAQLDTVVEFLQNDIVSVDIFGISPARPIDTAAVGVTTGDFSTTFAVGEEAATSIVGLTTEATPVTAPVDRANPVVRRGDSTRVDVVVRTRRVGHFFPAGTVDAFDVWLELVAKDDAGRTIFWSGMREDGGEGPVESSAHFYRTLLIDEHGNPIDKRNAWAARAVVYVNLIPPGAADTVHFRLDIPEDVGDEIQILARLNYRKFSWFNTQFAYAGVREGDEGSLTPDYDDGTWTFTGDTSNVSGALKEIPDVPVIMLAQDAVTLRVAGPDAEAQEPATIIEPSDCERWNDYGIGLFREGDLKGAEVAFRHATESDPENVDGWVNMGRVRFNEGNLEGAREVITHALSLDPQLARANYFFGLVLEKEGDYEGALERLDLVRSQYPRDRVVLNDIGRIRLQQRQYAQAITILEQVLDIDPEDLAAHYTLTLANNGLGDIERGLQHQEFYLRFKADESAQAITGPYLREHPDDNRERQPIHEHISVDLTGFEESQTLGGPE